MQHRTAKLASGIAALALVASATVVEPSPAQANANTVMFGAYAHPRSGENNQRAVERLEGRLGRKLALVRDYRSLDGDIGTGFHDWILGGGRQMMVSVRSKRGSSVVKWRDVANAQPGSRTYNDLVRLADGAKALRKDIIVTFNHEPESQANGTYGTDADFIAAWRKFVTVFRQRGATNAHFAWTMTSWAFEVDRADRRAAHRWYPGDAYVDYIGADPYNYALCRPNNPWEEWESLESIIAPFVAFGNQHPGKKLLLPEFGSVERQSGRKAGWLDEVRALMKRSSYADKFAAIIYFDKDDTCDWRLDRSSSAIEAAKRLNNDPFFRDPDALGFGGGGGNPPPPPPPPVPARTTGCFAVAGSPGDVALVNLTPVSATGPGDGKLVSSSVAKPPSVANVNFSVGTVDPNVAVAPQGPDKKVCFANSRHSSVHLVADHQGTIKSAAFVTATSSGVAKRVVDTRKGLGGGKLGRNARRCFSVAGSPGDVAVVNLTPVGSSGAGDGKLVSSSISKPPSIANVNFGRGTVDPNVAMAPLGPDKKVCFVNSKHSTVHLVADHLGTIKAGSFIKATSSGVAKRVVDTRKGLGFS